MSELDGQSDVNLTLDTIQTWKIPALKEYLKARGRQTNGRKDVLVARVFAAHEMNIPLCPTSQEMASDRKSQYDQLLCFSNSDKRLKDPSTITNSWVGEKDGIVKWPSLYLSDISTYFQRSDHPGIQMNADPAIFVKRLLSEYKKGKAYRYFTVEWLKEVMVTEDTDHPDVVILKAMCTPSFKIRDVPHSTWVSVFKQGEIHSAYCTCTAGLGGTCNHVAAILFRVEAAVKQGFTSPACTALPCTWTIPGKKAPLVLKPAVDTEWKQDRYGDKKKHKLVVPKKKLFKPVEDRHDITKGDKFDNLCDALKDLLPKAVLHSARPKPEVAIPVTTAGDNPSKGLLLQPFLINGYITLTQDEADAVERQTRGQNNNPRWKEAREWRITASVMHRVHTRVNTLMKKPDTAMDSLISSLLNPTDLSDIPSVKHGLNLEATAVDVYVSLMKKKHRDFQSSKCGLFVDCKLPHLGASPDMLTECSCCGSGLLEVKCPYSAAHTAPKAGTPGYLIEKNDSTVLNENHPYFTQVIAQMGITNRKWCDFMVYTTHGHFIQRIEFDDQKWEIVKNNVDYFFITYIVPKMIKVQIV